MSMSLNFEAMIKTIVGVEHIQETGESSIIKITRRIRDKFSSEFDTKVLSLLCELRRRHPYMYIWLNDWNEDLIQKITASGWPVVDRNMWLVPIEQNMPTLFRDLFQGAWGLFFCDEPILMKDRLSHLFKEPADLKKLLLDSNIITVII